MSAWREHLPRRRDAVLPLKLGALLGLGLMIPPAGRCLRTIANWFIGYPWQALGPTGNIGAASRALAEWLDRDHAPDFLSGLCVLVITGACAALLFHPRSFWLLLRRIPE